MIFDRRMTFRCKKKNDRPFKSIRKKFIYRDRLHNPDLLILDEPFSGLDPLNVEFMIEVVAELKAQHKTIIFSTHLMETAERLCDDIILINKSRKVIGGTLREVKGSFSKNLIALRIVGGEKVVEDNLAALAKLPNACRPNGNCNWQKTPIRKSFLEKIDEGVRDNYEIPRQIALA